MRQRFPISATVQISTSLTDCKMLPSIIEVPDSTDAAPEDVLSTSLNLMYPDDSRNIHGDAGSYVIYKSKGFGDVRLRLTDPQSEGSRKLFAHYLWNAGVLLAELISGLAEPGPLSKGGSGWSVEGEQVLEMGAGA